MMGSPDVRYRSLFEPMQIGPVTAPNRFYQVPHGTGLGHMYPHRLAAMRGVTAEGGWGVVCTECCSIHPSSDYHPKMSAALWDDGDIANLAAFTDAVHAHGALAGVELWHGGSQISNLETRTPTLGVRSMPSWYEPYQSKRMDRRDIRELRRWHLEAARRAKQAEFDIVYVYPAHGYLLSEFLSRAHNDRTDCYGGSLENRVRLLKELLEETREVIGDRCAVAIRFSADGLGGAHLSAAEAHDVVAMLAEIPDLWDLVVANYYGDEMVSSRYGRQGSLEDKVGYVKKLTSKPVVSVGRFTSPDMMVRQIRTGVLDFVGAARPSIADPFLPRKIREGRSDDIRECIGCNICFASIHLDAPIRCTQNPTIGEEWRQGWHPEKVPTGNGGSVLIVGAGAAGLEAAHILGKRGFTVTLCEARTEAGGRVTRESRLPGLAEWARVRDYRLGQIASMSNVSLYLGNKVSAEDVSGFDADHVLITTGASWRRNGIGRVHASPIRLDGAILTPDDFLGGTALPSGNVTVFDDDHYYMGSILACLLANSGATVTYVTTKAKAAEWSRNTGDQEHSHRQMATLGVKIRVNTSVEAFDGEKVSTKDLYSGTFDAHFASAIVLVTSRDPNDSLYYQLVGMDEEESNPRIQRIGDCNQPALIAHAVYAGHQAGRLLGLTDASPPRRDRVIVKSR